jgi:tripartite-type tricarboxylate transporter receptor subunit TctC
MQRRQLLRIASATARAGLLIASRARVDAIPRRQANPHGCAVSGWRANRHRGPPSRSNVGEALKAIVLVDNRGGAGGSLGADAVAKSAPDGQTLLMATVGTHAINPALYKNLSYDAESDFTPVALVALAPVAVVVHPSQPMTNLAELVDLAKHMPGKLNHGSAGVGTPGHLTAEMFKAAAGLLTIVG